MGESNNKAVEFPQRNVSNIMLHIRAHRDALHCRKRKYREAPERVKAEYAGYDYVARYG